MPAQLVKSRRTLLALVALTGLSSHHAGAQANTAEDTYADVNGVRIHYRSEGTGTPLVLIHGWPLNGDWWNDHLPALRKDFRVIAYDRRGFGASSGTPDGSADAADLEALLGHLGIASAHVLGHAAGGRTALALALQYPGRVRSLILYGAPPPAGFGLAWNGPDALPFGAIQKAARESGLDSAWRIIDRHPVIAGERLGPRAKATWLRMHKSYPGTDLLRDLQPSGQVPSPRVDRLSEIRVPTLVLTGDQEFKYLRIVADALAYGIPRAQRVTIEGGGHIVDASQPAKFQAVVLRFLRSVPAPTGM